MSKHGRIPERDFVFEIRNLHGPGSLGKLFTAIGNAEGLISDIVTTFVGKTHSIREITVSVFDEEHLSCRTGNCAISGSRDPAN